MKKLGKILVFAALGLFVVWAVFFCLRYLVFQKSVALGDGLKDHFGAVGAVFGNLHYCDDKFTILWKAAGWILTWFVCGFGFLMVIDGIFKKKPFMFIATAALVLTGYAVLDYIAYSGNYAHYIGRFAGNNTFYTLGLVGFIIMSFGIFALAVAGGVLCAISGNKEDAQEEAPAKEEPAPAPVEEPTKEEAPAEEPKEEKAPAEQPAEEPAPEEAPAEEPANEEAPAEDKPADAK